MANFYITPNGAGSKNGSNWDNAFAWSGINWGSVSAGDTLVLSGGTSKQRYIGNLNWGKSGTAGNHIKLELSTEAGHDGRAIIFGGRNNDLPHTYDPNWSSSGTAQNASGIYLGAHSYITIDGKKWRGITIHGFYQDGIQSSPGSSNVTIRYLDIYSNGEHKGSNGSWRTDKACIRPGGSDWLIEDCWLHRPGQDAIQNAHPVNIQRLTMRHNLITNEVQHKSVKHFVWNWREHPDGIQLYGGGRDCVIEDNIFAFWWHAAIIGDSYGDFDNGRFSRNLMFGNANAFRFHGRSINDNNVVEDNVSQKWRWYYDDNGTGYLNGEHLYLRGTGNVFRNNYWGNYGTFSLSNSPTWTNNYSDGTINNFPGSQSIQDANFTNPGPVGNSGENLVTGWSTRDYTIQNASITGITQTYTSPLQYLRQRHGIDYALWPDSFHANYANEPAINSLSAWSINATGTQTYQVDAVDVDGGTLTYSLANHPSWLSVNASSGLITAVDPGTDANFRVRVIIRSSNGKTTEAWLTINVGSGGSGNVAPTVQNPGTLSAQVNTDFRLQLQASDPNGDAITFTGSGFPSGFGVSSSGLISGRASSITDQPATVTVTVSDGSLSSSVNFQFVVTAGNNSGATTIIDPGTQAAEIDFDTLDVQIATTTANGLTAQADNLPTGVSLRVVQAISGGSSTGGGSGAGSTVDTTSVGLKGNSGQGTTTQTYNFGTVDGSNFTLVAEYLGDTTNGTNPGDPTPTGNTVAGFTEYRNGGAGSGNRYNIYRITSNRPLHSLPWGAFGISTTAENIINTAPNATVSGMSNGGTGTVTWSNLEGATVLEMVIESDSDGNNHGFGPVGDAVLWVLNDDGGNEEPGEVRIIGTPERPGRYDSTISISDANGAVGELSLRFNVSTRYGPIMSPPVAQSTQINTADSYQLVATSQNSLGITYKAWNLPDGMEIDEVTGIISGTPTKAGDYRVIVTAMDTDAVCDTYVLKWEVTGGFNENFNGVQGPIIWGQPDSFVAPSVAMSPTETLNLLDAYNRSEIERRDELVKTQLVNGETEYTTFKTVGDWIRDNPGGGGGGDSYSHPNHTGEVASQGDGNQTVQPAAISNKPTATIQGTDKVLFLDVSDGQLKQGLASDLSSSGLNGADGESAYEIWLSNGNSGTEQDFLNSLIGNQGPAGASASIQVGTVTTGAAGTNASVTNAGTTQNAVFNFTIPRGADGVSGTGSGAPDLNSQSVYGRTDSGIGVGTSIAFNSLLGLIGGLNQTQIANLIDIDVNALASYVDTQLSQKASTSYVNSELAGKFALAVGNALVSALGSSQNNMGNYTNTITPDNTSQRVINEAVGLAIQKIVTGDTSIGALGAWQNIVEHSQITGAGFNGFNATLTSWGRMQYRYIPALNSLQIRGAVSRSSGQGFTGPKILFTTTNTPNTEVVHPAFMYSSGATNDGFRAEALVRWQTNGNVIFTGSWSAAETLIVNATLTRV